MKTMKSLLIPALGLSALFGCMQTTATAQIAYEPTIGFVPTGVTMTVTPVVSADRRCVRLTVNAFFNDLNGFSTFSFPGGAVGGGNFGGGAVGGGNFGGGAVGGGNFGGGAAGFNAGMNGVIGDEGYESGVQVANGMNTPPAALQPGMIAGLSRVAKLSAGVMPCSLARRRCRGRIRFRAGFEDEAALMMAMENGSRRSVRSSSSSLARSPRRATRKSTKSTKSTRRQSTRLRARAADIIPRTDDSSARSAAPARSISGRARSDHWLPWRISHGDGLSCMDRWNHTHPADWRGRGHIFTR